MQAEILAHSFIRPNTAQTNSLNLFDNMTEKEEEEEEEEEEQQGMTVKEDD